MRIKIGIRKESPHTFATVEKALKKAGIRVRIRGVSLTGFSRFMVDMGHSKIESLQSIAGHTYNQVGEMEVKGDLERIKRILATHGAEILKEERDEGEAQTTLGG